MDDDGVDIHHGHAHRKIHILEGDDVGYDDSFVVAERAGSGSVALIMLLKEWWR